MTTTALGQSTTSSVPIARTGTTAAVTSVGRNFAAYGSTALAPPVASETRTRRVRAGALVELAPAAQQSRAQRGRDGHTGPGCHPLADAGEARAYDEEHRQPDECGRQ